MQSFSQLCIECFLWIHISPGIYLFSCHGFHYGYWLCFAMFYLCDFVRIVRCPVLLATLLDTWNAGVGQSFASRPLWFTVTSSIVKSNGYDLHLYAIPICCTHQIGSSWQQCNAKLYIYDGQMLKLLKNISDSWLLLLILLSYYSTTNNLSIYTMTVDVLCCKQKCMYIYALLLMFLKMILFGLICI